MSQFSVYRNSYDTQGVVAGFPPLLERIQGGTRGLDAKTAKANILVVGDPKVYKAY